MLSQNLNQARRQSGAQHLRDAPHTGRPRAGSPRSYLRGVRIPRLRDAAWVRRTVRVDALDRLWPTVPGTNFRFRSDADIVEICVLSLTLNGPEQPQHGRRTIARPAEDCRLRHLALFSAKIVVREWSQCAAQQTLTSACLSHRSSRYGSLKTNCSGRNVAGRHEKLFAIKNHVRVRALLSAD